MSLSLNTVTSWAAILAVGAVGLFYFLGMFKKNKNGEDDRLINLLKSTVDELEKKVNQQDKDIKELTNKVGYLGSINKTLTDILQGRDDKTTDFYDKILNAIEIGKQTNESVIQMGKTHADLMKLLIQHMDNVEANRGTAAVAKT